MKYACCRITVRECKQTSSQALKNHQIFDCFESTRYNLIQRGGWKIGDMTVFYLVSCSQNIHIVKSNRATERETKFCKKKHSQ